MARRAIANYQTVVMSLVSTDKKNSLYLNLQDTCQYLNTSCMFSAVKLANFCI